MTAESSAAVAASHHGRITGASLGERRNLFCLFFFLLFFGRPQQGLKSTRLTQSVSHSVSLPSHFTGQRRDAVGGHEGSGSCDKSTT